MIYQLEHQFTLPNGQMNKPLIRQYIDDQMYLFGWSWMACARQWVGAARLERNVNRQRMRWNAQCVQDPEQIAAAYAYDVDALRDMCTLWNFKVGIRFGAKEQYERFKQALSIARERERSAA